MKISLEWDDILGRTSLISSPGRYDGFPSPGCLDINWAFRSRPSSNRQLVAGVLAFRNFISGEVSAEGDVDKVVADSVRAFMSPRSVDVVDVNMRPKEPLRGSAAFLLGVSGSVRLEPEWLGFDSPRQLSLVDYAISARSGVSFEASEVAVPTNSFMFSRGFDHGQLEFWLPRIACGVLMADDFEVGEIWLPDYLRSSVDETGRSRLDLVVALLKSVDLGVRLI